MLFIVCFFIFTALCVTGEYDAGKIGNLRKIRIADGSEAGDGQFPYLVSVEERTGYNKFQHICGGTLITPSTVLTLAYCIFRKDPQRLQAVGERIIFARVGMNSIVNLQYGINMQLRKIVELIPHPEYNTEWPNYNDLLLGKVEAAFVMTTHVSFIPIREKIPEANTTCQLVGFGAINGTGTIAEDLHYSNMTIKNDSYCNDKEIVVGEKHFSRELLLCPADEAGKACVHNAGDGLVCDSFLVGIQVFVVGDHCNVGSAGTDGFVNAVYFRDWIKNNTNNFER